MTFRVWLCEGFVTMRTATRTSSGKHTRQQPRRRMQKNFSTLFLAVRLSAHGRSGRWPRRPVSELSEVLLYQSIEGDLYVEVEIIEYEAWDLSFWCLLVDCRINKNLSFANDFGGAS